MLIGLGHDIQIISELNQTVSLKIPGIFFTEGECQYFNDSKNALQSMTGCFAAKEAFFKALPNASLSFYWTDIEVRHDSRRAPYFQFYGCLNNHLTSYGWTVHLSISHSGDYASAVVVISPLPSKPLLN